MKKRDLCTTALDAATQLDKAIRNGEASLEVAVALADMLSDQVVRQEFLNQTAILRALNAIGVRPSTVDELGARIADEARGLRLAASGDAAAARSALSFCLALHDMLLRSQDSFLRERERAMWMAA